MRAASLGKAAMAAFGVALSVALSGGAFAALSAPIAAGTLPCPATATLDARVARQGGAAIVVLGNSTASQAVQGSQLGRAVGRPGRVLKATLPSASPLTWYAVLAHRVFARGLRPELIVVAAPPQVLWQTRPTSSLDLRELLELAGTGDPVVQRHLGADGAGSVLRTIELRRQTARAGAIGALSRLALPGLTPEAQQTVLDSFVVGGGGGRRVPSPRASTTLRRALFEPGALASTVPDGAQAEPEPEPEPEPELDAPTGDDSDVPHTPIAALPDLDDTVLPDLVALAHAHGATLVFAATPTRLGLADAADQEAREAMLTAWADANGTAYVPFRRLGFTDDDFDDNFHVTDAAALVYTDALAWVCSRWLGPGRARRVRPIAER